MNRSDIQKNFYNTLIESYNSNKDIFASYGDVVTLKRRCDDQDKDKEPSAGSNRGTKRRRSGKEESSKEATQKESKSTSSSKGASRSQPKSSGKSAQAEEHGPRVDDLEEPLHQEFNTRNDDILLVREIIAIDERLWNPSGSQTPDREWNKTKTNARGRQVIPFDHFINNDLEYLKRGSLSQKYTTSLTKMKAADYGHVKWIKDKVPRKRMEDLQMAVESYQKKINLSRPDSYHLGLRKMTPYTAYHNIQGIIYQDDMDRNRLMRTDELHKFSDGTLNHVRTALNDIATGIQMELNTLAGNPVKEILLKLNLPNHRILEDGGEELSEEITINEYLKEVRDDSGPGIVKLAFEENIKFEFWGQCVEELKDNMFFAKENEDSHEHIANIIDIIDLFQSPDVSRDQGKEGNIITKERDVVLDQISNFNRDMNMINEEVRMVQHKYENPMEGRISTLEETLINFIKESFRRQKKNENMVWEIKKNYYQTFKAHASSIKKLESHLGKIAELIQDRETGSLPSATETNPKGLEHAITTKSGLNYKTPQKPLENNSQPKPSAEETSTTDNSKEPDKPKQTAESHVHFIPFLGRLKKEKEKEQFKKFLKKLQQLSINIPFIEALEQMPKYTKFMKDLLSKKEGYMDEDHKIPIILGRPFLATAHAMIDVFNKKLSVKVGNETVTFDIKKSIKFSSLKDDICLSIDMEDDNDEADQYADSGVFSNQNDEEPTSNPTLFTANTKEPEKKIPKLKELPSTLEYASLDNNHEFPVIISSSLSGQEKKLLL
ncbi:hypothetical protein Tco_1246282 [Tanacetum coccineum]